jgi:hypothetical protein
MAISREPVKIKRRGEGLNEIGAPASGIQGSRRASPDAPAQDLKAGTWTQTLSSRIDLLAQTALLLREKLIHNLFTAVRQLCEAWFWTRFGTIGTSAYLAIRHATASLKCCESAQLAALALFPGDIQCRGLGAWP